MSILNDPRVSEIDGGYRVINDEAGPLKIFLNQHWSGDDWRAYFDSSTDTVRHPSRGIAGSGFEQVEEAVEWALRNDATAEVLR